MIPALIGPDWRRFDRESLPVFNPATGEEIERVPLLGQEDVDLAVRAASNAQRAWAHVSVMERQRLMFAFKAKLEEHVDELAAIVTRHHGKTLAEARGEVRRGIEVVDFACAATTILQGRTLRDVGSSVDQDCYRYPVGVVAGITPFNFPVMIPLWMFPLAVVCGNTFVLKPSERTPLGAIRLAELFLESGFPDGVLNVVHGTRDCVNALITHPLVGAVSFVGSEAVAAHVYREAARTGKRVQSAGGAKNHIFVMPDADIDAALPSILNSAFGNAGERCLAGSIAVAIGSAAKPMLDAVNDGASKLVVGPGDVDGVDIGPLIRDEHRTRVLDHIARGEADGARVTTDGRGHIRRPGYFLGPTVLDGVTHEMAVGRDEIRPRALGGVREDARRRDRHGQQITVRQHVCDLYLERPRGAAIPRFGRSGHGRHQRRHGAAIWILSVLRLEGIVLRRSSPAGPRRGGVLHAQEDGHLALVEPALFTKQTIGSFSGLSCPRSFKYVSMLCE